MNHILPDRKYTKAAYKKPAHIRILFTYLFLLSLWIGITPPVTVFASTLYSSKTVAEGETYTDSNFDMQGWYGALTFTNNGTVDITDGFILTYNAEFINNGTFSFTGNNSTFDVSGGCSFTNNGTATISDCYNLCLVNTFINSGTLFLSDISNASSDGFSNTGTIVYGDNVNPYLISSLKDKTTGSGRVISQAEYEASAPSSYQITYDLNGGAWKETPDSAIFSYTHDSSNIMPWYTFENDAPFDHIRDNLIRDNYQFAGWICPEKGETEPSPYFTILTQWQSDITLTAVWEPARQYVFYRLEGGYFPDGSTDLTIENDGLGNTYTLFNIESEDFTLPTPEKGGYIFIGWGLGGTDKVFPTVTIPKGTAGNVSYTAKWNPIATTPYTVNVYYMDENGNYGSSPDKTFHETGTTGTYAIIPPVTYLEKGFVFDSGISTNRDIITADGKLVLSLYYQRSLHDITFMSYDGSSELYSCQGYYGTDITFAGDIPTMEDENYIYTFAGWSNEALSDYGITSLGKISADKTYYAAFERAKKDSPYCTVTFEDITGFDPPAASVVTINKGEDFQIELFLADEKFYVGTEEWIFPTAAYLGVVFDDNRGGLFLGKDYTITRNGNEGPVTLTIPNVTGNLHITFRASYHEEHDFSPSYDRVVKEPTYTETGLVTHFCYKCGKTVDEVTPVLIPDNTGTDNDNEKNEEEKEDNGEDDEDDEDNDGGMISNTANGSTTPAISSPTHYRRPTLETPTANTGTTAADDNSSDKTGSDAFDKDPVTPDEPVSDDTDPEKLKAKIRQPSDEPNPYGHGFDGNIITARTQNNVIVKWICIILSASGVTAAGISIYTIKRKQNRK